MLRKKSLKKHRLPMVDVNVTSLMDIITTMLFFLLLVASFAKYSVLNGTALASGKPEPGEKKPVFTLQVTLKESKAAEIWLGPLEGLPIVDEPRLRAYLARSFAGSGTGYGKPLRAASAAELGNKLQELLIPIKKAFPGEVKAVLTVHDPVKYQDLVTVMGSLRELEPSREGFLVEDLVGRKEKTRVLFPTVIVTETAELEPREGA